MPKEVVRSNLQKNSWVAVGWDKADSENVQLGVSLGYGFRFVDKHGNVLDDHVDYEYSKIPGVAQSLWFTFTSREQMNELIRNLRKARDSSYGRDE